MKYPDSLLMLSDNFTFSGENSFLGQHLWWNLYFFRGSEIMVYKLIFLLRKHLILCYWSSGLDFWTKNQFPLPVPPKSPKTLDLNLSLYFFLFDDVASVIKIILLNFIQRDDAYGECELYGGHLWQVNNHHLQGGFYCSP